MSREDLTKLKNLWVSIAVFRLSVFGFIAYHHWAGTAALWHVLLVLLLYPEALLVPEGQALTWMSGLTFALLLALGSGLYAGLALAVSRLRRASSSSSPSGT